MKKLLITLFLLAVVAIAATYILIPNSNFATETIRVATNHNTVFRVLTEPETLSKLVKHQTKVLSPGLSAFEYNHVNMQFQERMNDIIEVGMDKDGRRIKSIIKVISKGEDSTFLEWRMPLATTTNPIKRIKQYIQVKGIKTDMASFLKQLETFVGHNENIYGITIKRTKLSDSLLITTKSATSTLPSTETYYNMIKQLQVYAENQNALVTNYPMLNITKINETQYETMVALPLNKEVPSYSSIQFKRMVPGNILVTETKGGLIAINAGFSKLSNYIMDHGLVSPAIPFQSLVTDRLANTDSSQWVTKLNYPIF